MPPPSLKVGLPSVGKYYEIIPKLPNSKFKFNFGSEETVLKLLKDFDGNNTRGLICLLPLDSKIIEKVIHDQTKFSSKKLILFTDISQFLGYFFQWIMSKVFKQKNSYSLYLIFHRVNQNILIKKIELIGFSKETTNWLISYLSNRKLKFHIKNIFSKPGNLISAVPQGPTSWPLLFLVYITDILQADCKLLLFADDTCLKFQHKDVTNNVSLRRWLCSALIQPFFDYAMLCLEPKHK